MDRVASQVNASVLRKSIQFIAALQSRGMQIRSAFLYGSYAKGHARRDSDIDIAVVSQDLSGDWLDDYCSLTRLADDIDPRMQVIPFLPQDFRDENPLVWEIKTTGIPLLGNGKGGQRRLTTRRAPRRRAQRA